MLNKNLINLKNLNFGLKLNLIKINIILLLQIRNLLLSDESKKDSYNHRYPQRTS